MPRSKNDQDLLEAPEADAVAADTPEAPEAEEVELSEEELMLQALGITADEFAEVSNTFDEMDNAEVQTGGSTNAAYFHKNGLEAGQTAAKLLATALIKRFNWAENRKLIENTSARKDGSKSVTVAAKQQVPIYDEIEGTFLPKANFAFYTKEGKLSVTNPEAMEIDPTTLGFIMPDEQKVSRYLYPADREIPVYYFPAKRPISFKKSGGIIATLI